MTFELMGPAVIVFAGDMLLKSTIVLSLGLIAARAASHDGARVAMILRLTFAAVLALPLVTAIVPTINRPILDIDHDALNPVISAAAILLVWVSGSVIGISRLIGDALAARSVVRRAVAVSNGRTVNQLIKAAGTVGSRTIPELRQTSEVSTVALIGWKHPVILLPDGFQSWADEELTAVLCHELEHLRHHDWIALMAERLASALFWVNPLIVLAFRSSCIAREIVADDAVVRSRFSLDVYAARMISSARASVATPAMAASLAFSAYDMTEMRVHALFAQRRRRRLVTARVRVLHAAAALSFLATLSAIQPWRCVAGASASIAISICP